MVAISWTHVYNQPFYQYPNNSKVFNFNLCQWQTSFSYNFNQSNYKSDFSSIYFCNFQSVLYFTPNRKYRRVKE